MSRLVLTTRNIPRPFESVDRHAPVQFWLWPNLLSLQAPLVAVLWQVLLTRSMHLRLNPFEPWTLGLTVWLIYVTDHLIDTAQPAGGEWEPARKDFCRGHWHKFLYLAIAGGFILTVLVRHFLPAATVRAGWQLSAVVACYFALIHLAPANWRRGWPRELAVATLFTVGTLGIVWMANGQGIAPLLPPALLFMLLCWTNCSLIETWEWEASGAHDAEAPNRVTRWVAEHLTVVGVVIATASGVLGLGSLLSAGFAVAASLSGLALALLGISRSAIPARFASPAADLALCTPIVVLVFLWLR